MFYVIGLRIYFFLKFYHSVFSLFLSFLSHLSVALFCVISLNSISTKPSNSKFLLDDATTSSSISSEDSFRFPCTLYNITFDLQIAFPCPAIFQSWRLAVPAHHIFFKPKYFFINFSLLLKLSRFLNVDSYFLTNQINFSIEFFLYISQSSI